MFTVRSSEQSIFLHFVFYLCNRFGGKRAPILKPFSQCSPTIDIDIVFDYDYDDGDGGDGGGVGQNSKM